jgi:DNA-directed RNA polymerase specialized sigma24 family protein
LSNNQLAEELTLASLKKAVLRNLVDNIEPHDYLIAVFTIARNEVCNYLRTNKSKPAWPVLSNQEQDVIALKLGASLDNRSISSILGLSESSVTSTVAKSLCKLRDCPEIKQPPHN